MSHIRDFSMQLDRDREMEYDGPADREEHIEELREEIEPSLIQELGKRGMSTKEIKKFIEHQVDERT